MTRCPECGYEQGHSIMCEQGVLDDIRASFNHIKNKLMFWKHDKLDS